MGKKFFSLFLSTLLTISVVFAIISVARIIVNRSDNWSDVEPVKIVSKGSPYKHHYDSLTAKQKHTYNEVLEKVYQMPEKIQIPSIEEEDAEVVFQALIDDNPDLYFVKGYKEIRNHWFRTFCVMEYTMTDGEYREAEEKINGICENVISGLSAPSDQWQTELEINDYIVDNCEYRFEEENGFAYSTAYSVFVNGEAACEGYSKAAKMLFDKAKIESMTVRGKSISTEEVNHMWNIVRINGEYYNFDCTWNDPVFAENEKEIPSIVDRIQNSQKRYEYFNLSDEMIKDTHIPENQRVECTATKENYFNKTAIVFDDFNSDAEDKILFLVCHAIENGKSFVSVQFEHGDDYRRAADNLGKSGEINRCFREYEKQNGKKIKTDNVYRIDEEQKILIVIEYV